MEEPFDYASARGKSLYEETDQSDISSPLSNPCLLVIGSVGSGKSTLINYFVNYIEGGWLGSLKAVVPSQHCEVNVAGFPPHRESASRVQGRSQTSDCTVYQFARTQYSLTVIDTPGFTHGSPIDASRVADIDGVEGPITGVLLVVSLSGGDQSGEIQSAVDSLVEVIPGLRYAKLVVVYTNAESRGFKPDSPVQGYEPALQFVLPSSAFAVENFRSLPPAERVECYVQWVTAMHNINQTIRVLRGRPLLAEVEGFDIERLLEFCRDGVCEGSVAEDIQIEVERKGNGQEEEPASEVVSIEVQPDAFELVPPPAPQPFAQPNCSTLLLLTETLHEKVVFLRHFVATTLAESPLQAEVIKRIEANPAGEFVLKDEAVTVRSESGFMEGCTRLVLTAHGQTHVVLTAPEMRRIEDDIAEPEYVGLLTQEIVNTGVLKSVVLAVSEDRKLRRLPTNISRMFDEITPPQSERIMVSSVVARSEDHELRRLPTSISRVFEDITPPQSEKIMVSSVVARSEKVMMLCENLESVKSGASVMAQQGSWVEASKVFQAIVKMQETLPPITVVLTKKKTATKEELKAKAFRLAQKLMKAQLTVEAAMKVLAVQEKAERERERRTYRLLSPRKLDQLLHHTSNVLVDTYEYVKTPHRHTICKYPGCNLKACHENCGLVYMEEEGCNGFRGCVCMSGDVCNACSHGYEHHLHGHYLKELRYKTFQDVFAEHKKKFHAKSGSENLPLSPLATSTSRSFRFEQEDLARIHLHKPQSDSSMTRSILTQERERLAGTKQSLLRTCRQLKEAATGSYFSQEVEELVWTLKETLRKLQEKENRDSFEAFLASVRNLMTKA